MCTLGSQQYIGNIFITLIGIFLCYCPTVNAQHLSPTTSVTARARIPLDLPSGLSTIVVTGLRAAHNYTLIYQVVDPSIQSHVALAGTTYPPNTPMHFFADTDSVRLTFYTDAVNLGWLSVACVDCPRPSKSNRIQPRSTLAMTFSGGLTPEELIRDVFIGGGCFDVFNITYDGDPVAIGMFENGDSTIGMSTGVVMSTGAAEDVTGPNISDSTTRILLGQSTDQDIMALNPLGNANDHSIFEFDFVPTTNRAGFRFAFASEEYCQFIDDIYNDNFGFFVSGPGLNGPFQNNAENIALVPGTSDIISINSVNSGVNSTFYKDNIPIIFSSDPTTNSLMTCASSILSDETTNGLFEPNGYTTVLSAELDVMPCDTYHIKLAIADFGDQAYDSWVFLEANSFDAGQGFEFALDLPGENNMTDAYEGCDQKLVLRRTLISEDDKRIVIHPIIGGSAQAGVDYAPLPDSLVLESSDSLLELDIEVYADDIDELPETIEIVYSSPCQCGFDTIVFNINDYAPAEVIIEDVALCDDSVEIIPAISGGLAPYTYAWSTGEDGETIISQPGIGTYALTITDVCGSTDTDSVALSLPDATDFSFTQQSIALCEDNSPVDIGLTYVGTSSVDFIINRPDGGLDTVQVPSSPGTYSVTDGGEYVIQGVLVDGCPTTASDTIDLRIGGVAAAPIIAGDPCAGDSLLAVTMNATSAAPPLTYTWSHGVTTMDDFIELQLGEYFVTVTDDVGCIYLDTISLISAVEVQVNVDQPRCGDTLGLVSLTERSPIIEYRVLPDSTRLTTWPFTLPVGMHDIVLLDPIGCADTINIDILPSAELSVDLPSIDSIIEGGSTQLIPVVNREDAEINEVSWTPQTDLVTTDWLSATVSPEVTTSYVMTVTDTNDCTTHDTILVYVIPPPEIFLPTAFSPNGDGINDRFYPQSGPAFSIVNELAIYDRWGALVMRRVNFPINEINLGWDGTADGQALDPGLFTYYIVAQRIDDVVYEDRGEVLLVR